MERLNQKELDALKRAYDVTGRPGRGHQVPAEQAALIGESFNKDQVIIFSWNREQLGAVVTTWGRTLHDADLATAEGNRLKKALGWANSKCNTVSSRVLQIKDDLHEIQTAILDNLTLFGGGEKVNKVFDIINRLKDRIDGKEGGNGNL